MDQSTLARRLPEEFLELPGSPSQRALLIVYRRWTAYPDTEQAQLAQTLLSLLEPLLRSESPKIPNSLRDACENAVRSWEMQSMATDRSVPPDQQPTIAASRPRQIRFVSATIAPLDGTGYGAQVKLERPPTDWYVGFANCSTEREQLRSVAEATLDALRQAVPERGLRFELQDVGSFEACGHSGMLVALQVKHKERSWSLIGLCADTREDQFGATALAVLNGTNRLLGTG